MNGLKNVIFHIISKKPWQLFYAYSSEMQRVIDDLLKNESFDLIQVYFFRMAEYILKSPLPKVLDTCDVLSLNYQRFLKFRRGIWKCFFFLESLKSLKYELDMLRRFNAVVVVSNVERRYLERCHNCNNLFIVPNGVDFEYFHPINENRRSLDLLFTASYDYQPNEDAAYYFAKEIFPIIRRQNPNIRFLIVGSNPSKKLQRLNDKEGIVVTGYVPDTRPYFSKTAMFVCFMRMGGGVSE